MFQDKYIMADDAEAVIELQDDSSDEGDAGAVASSSSSSSAKAGDKRKIAPKAESGTSDPKTVVGWGKELTLHLVGFRPIAQSVELRNAYALVKKERRVVCVHCCS